MTDWLGRTPSGFGPDWLLGAQDGERGEVTTFYSYKGGTGRSLALVNCAGLIAQALPTGSKPMLLIDFDLEAPGLHRYLASFVSDPDSAERKGVLELFEDLDEAVGRELRAGQSAKRLDDEAAARIAEAIDLAPYVIETGLSRVFLLQAGRFDSTYDRRLMTFRWDGLFDRAPALFRCLAERWAREYSFVFVDSRTGLSDTTGVTTTLLPDSLVIVFTPNSQSLTGVSHLVRKAVSYRSTSSDLRRLRVYPLPSRVDTQVEHFRRVWRIGETSHPLFGDVVGYQPLFAQVFSEVFEAEAPTEPGLAAYFDVVQVPHSADYAYGERLCFTADASNDSLSLRGAYEQFLPWLVSGAQPWEPPGQVLAAHQAERFLTELGAQATPGGDEWAEWFDHLQSVVGDRHGEYAAQASSLSDEVRANINLALALALASGGNLARSAQLLEREGAAAGVEACYATLAAALAQLLVTWRQHLTPLVAASEDRRAWLAAADRLMEVMRPGRALSAQWAAERLRLVDHAPWLGLDADALRAVQERSGGKLRTDQRLEMLRTIRQVALARRADGDLPGAHVLGRFALETCRRVFGDEHAETLKAQGELAHTLRARGDRAGAVELEARTRESDRGADSRRERTEQTRLFRIYLSSSGDVPEERQSVARIVEEVAQAPALRGRVRLQLVSWDAALLAPTGGETPQSLVNQSLPTPGECDLTVAIVWSRLGTPLPRDPDRSDPARDEAGAAWKIQNALAAGKPVLLYRRISKLQLDIDDPDFESKRAQFQEVSQFFAEFAGPVTVYQSPAEFTGLLTRDLEQVLASADRPGSDQPTASPQELASSSLDRRADELESRLRRAPVLSHDFSTVTELVRGIRRAAIRIILDVADADAETIGEVVRALERGDPGPARIVFAQLAQPLPDSPTPEDDARRARSSLYEAGLAHDEAPEVALQAYERAAGVESYESRVAVLNAELLIRVGRVEEGVQRLSQVIGEADARLGTQRSDRVAQQVVAVCHELVGDLWRARGELASALEAYRRALAVVEESGAGDDVELLLRDVALRRHKIADMLAGQGDHDGALLAYRSARETIEALAAGKSANATWQFELAASGARLGRLYERMNDLSAALGEYRNAAEMIDGLAVREPGNPNWQRDLLTLRRRMGDVSVEQGNLQEGLSAHRAALETAHVLFAADPDDVERRWDLAVGFGRLGDVLTAGGQLDQALRFFRQGSSILKELVAHDPSKDEWRREHSMVANRIGDALLRQGDADAALDAYREGLAGFRALAERDPASVQCTREVCVARIRVGDALATLGFAAGATEEYEGSLRLIEQLVDRDADNPQLMMDLAIVCARLAQSVDGSAKDVRRQYLTRGRDLVAKLDSASQLRAWQHGMAAWFDEQLAQLPAS